MMTRRALSVQCCPVNSLYRRGPFGTCRGEREHDVEDVEVVGAYTANPKGVERSLLEIGQQCKQVTVCLATTTDWYS